MTTTVAFVGACAGDMAVVECGDGKKALIDCGIEPANQAGVMRDLFLLLDASEFDMFFALNVVESRVQGLGRINDRFYIRKMCDAGMAQGSDAGVGGYKNLREQTGAKEIDKPVLQEFGSTRMGLVRAVPSAKADKPGGPLILRIADDGGDNGENGSVLFMSDATTAFWDEALAFLPLELLRADVLVAGGHGAFGLGAEAGDVEISSVVRTLCALQPSVLIIPDRAFDDADMAPAERAIAKFQEACPKAEVMRIGETGPATFTLSAKGVQIEVNDEQRPVQRLAS